MLSANFYLWYRVSLLFVFDTACLTLTKYFATLHKPSKKLARLNFPHYIKVPRCERQTAAVHKSATRTERRFRGRCTDADCVCQRKYRTVWLYAPIKIVINIDKHTMGDIKRIRFKGCIPNRMIFFWWCYTRVRKIKSKLTFGSNNK